MVFLFSPTPLRASAARFFPLGALPEGASCRLELPMDSRPLLVLNVNGDAQQRGLWRQRLHSRACLSVSVASAGELQQILGFTRPDAALVCDNLPDLQAPELVRLLPPQLPLLAIASHPPAWADHAMRADASDDEWQAALAQLAQPVAADRRVMLRQLAHDMRNVLNPLRTGVAFLQRDSATAASHRPLLQRLDQLLGQLAAQVARLSPADTGSDSPPPVAGNTGSGQTLRARRVLLADDSPAVRDAMGAMLSSRGHTVCHAQDGQQALELAASWQPDVVLLDLRMPGLDGFAVARRLREQFGPGLRLLLMSGLTLDAVLLRHAQRAGFDACIDKVAGAEQWFAAIEQEATSGPGT